MKQGIDEKLFSRLFEWRLNLKTKTVLGEYLTGTECSLEFPMINNHYTGVRHSYGYAQIVDSLTRSAGSSEKGIAKIKQHCLYYEHVHWVPTSISAFTVLCITALYLTVLPKYGGFAKLCLEERENTEVCINQLRASVQLLFNQDFLTQIQAVHQTSAEDLIKMEIHRLSEDEFCSGASFVPRVGGSHEDDGWIISFVHNERTNTSQASFHCNTLHTHTPISI